MSKGGFEDLKQRKRAADRFIDGAETYAEGREKKASKRLNVDIDAETYRALKVKAASLDQDVSTVVRGLVREFLAR